MSEASMRSHLVKKLASLDAVSIESPTTGKGVPDVNTTCGWIECKWLRSWPKNCEISPVKFLHPLSVEQQIWLWRRWKCGGNSWVMAKVSSEWFMWEGHIFKESGLWDNMTRPQMIERSVLYFKNGLESETLINYMLEKRRLSSEDV